MIRSKWREVLLCLKAGRVTLAYPFVQDNKGHLGGSAFRGRPAIDGEKCLGCGACAQVCPPRLISVTDQKGERLLELDYARCTYCGRCQDVCPTWAAYLSQEFELATNSKEDMKIRVSLRLAECEICGAAFTTCRLLEKLEKEFSPEWAVVKEEPPQWLRLCPNCRQTKTGTDMQGGIRHG